MSPTIQGTRAQARFVRMSAKKVRPVLDLVRGEPVVNADEILQFTPREAARQVRKVLQSAVANAVNNDSLPGDELFVAACYADEGPTLKRFRPRARGRATRINKRTCHITVVVDRLDAAELEQLRERQASTGQSNAAAAARARRVAASRGEEESADDEITDEVDEVVDEVTETDADDVVDTDEVVEESDAPEAATVEGPYGEGSHPVTDDGEMPEGYPIKGNEDSMKFHTPESPWYQRTIAEVWFADEASAEAAGFVNAVAPADDADDDTEEDA
ncbi:MAG: 50S ribosomal protein L22 [Actinomycetota bacterium]